MIGKRETLPGIVREEIRRRSGKAPAMAITSAFPAPVGSGGGTTAPPNPDAEDFTSHVGDTGNPHGVTAAQVGADATGTAASAVSAHNSDPTAHGGIPSGGSALPYYDVKAVIGTHNIAYYDGHANKRRAGVLVSPLGGLAWGIMISDNITKFSIPVTNSSGSTVARDIRVLACDDELYYSIDSGTKTRIITGTTTNTTVTISIPPGDHRVNFYHINGNNQGMLVVGDWLGGDVAYDAGEAYYG